ncbi:MAG: molybdenum cofactor guanylyltransferase [Ectothiorhodospiraceae bacterium]|nr:molybdenum cofactor guanylyltransferase [Ectothiorhodospiraceae bacterium]MCH8505603.1 molybdenum cofactor guanylyltransferase [Ectothiorhodospiraceae bacterium]
MTAVTGLVLAGGRATRMGGMDKGLVPLNGTAMVEHIVSRLRPQVQSLLINANRNRADYERLGFPVVADAFGDYAGPLAGMAAGLAAADTELVCCVPCDSPLIPPDLVSRLLEARAEAGAAIAVASGLGRLQPVFALIPRALLTDLQQSLEAGERKIDRWYDRHGLVSVDFSDAPDTFLNVNTPEERASLEARLMEETASR